MNLRIYEGLSKSAETDYDEAAMLVWTSVGSFSINDAIRMETLESEWKSLGN